MARPSHRCCRRHDWIGTFLLWCCILLPPMHAGSASSQLRAGTLLAARNVLDTALQRRNLLLDSISSSNRRIRRTQRIRERYDDDNNLNIGHDVVDPVRHESNLPAAAVTTPAVHTFVDKAAQRRTGLLRAIPALTRRRRRGGSQLSDHSHYLHKTLEVVSIKTEKIRQHLVKQMPNTGFFYGISPKLVQTYTTDATPSVKPLPLKQAVTLTLDELRSIRQEMESLRDEIRALKRNMLGEEGDEALLDPEAVLAQKRKKQREFDRIGREVERWAQHLLFEQDGEVDGWKEVACNKVMQASLNPDGRTVAYLKWMKDSRGSYASPDDDREYPCIKVFSTIDAPLEVVCQYLSDERKMAEYNDLIVQHKEVEEISSHGKICWGQTPAILFIQPRDFLTYCHHRWLRDGTQVLVNQACDSHENFTLQNPQAFALRGANFISRHPDDPSKTRIALLAHASPGPDVPHWASKTAVKALVPIEPFKLFHKINKGIINHRKELEQALPAPTEMVSQDGTGPSARPAGMAQMGYACFWPQGGGLHEEGSGGVGPLDKNDSTNSLGDENDDNEGSVSAL